MLKETKKLDDEKLEQFVGGKFTGEAQEWLDKNAKRIVQRAKRRGEDNSDYVTQIVMLGRWVNDVISLDSLKKELNKFVDVYDLN